jgi:hypothetical protein
MVAFNFYVLSFTASQVGWGALAGRNPKIGRSGIENNVEFLWGCAQGERSEILGLYHV